jgi:hypothetical protein
MLNLPEGTTASLADKQRRCAIQDFVFIPLDTLEGGRDMPLAIENVEFHAMPVDHGPDEVHPQAEIFPKRVDAFDRA